MHFLPVGSHTHHSILMVVRDNLMELVLSYLSVDSGDGVQVSGLTGQTPLPPQPSVQLPSFPFINVLV